MKNYVLFLTMLASSFLFSQNKENVLTVLDTYIEKLQEFKKHIGEYDEEGVKNLIYNANKIKRIIR